MAPQHQRQIVETPTEARQAEPGPSVLALLTISTGMAVLILGVGIGLTATMFSIVKGIVLSELPFEHADRILFLGTRLLDRNETTKTVALHDYVDWKARQGSFEDLAAFEQTTFNLSSSGAPERVRGAYVSAGLLPLLHIKPLVGRVFGEHRHALGRDAPEFCFHRRVDRRHQ